MSTDRRLLSGWGRTAPTAADVARPLTEEEVCARLADPPGRGILARGRGRAYGDAAQNAGGLVLDMGALDAVKELDESSGRIRVQGGASFDELMRALVPRGFFVPVSAGTRHISLGGAIAADVHGKNHHVDGSLCAHVERMRIAVPGGEVLDVGPGDDAFEATAGGMGLTGVVLEATLRLKPIETSRIVVDTERAENLDDLMARMAAGDHRYGYTVAWVDCLARGARLGRGVLTRGDFATRDQLAGEAEPRRFGPRELLATPPYVPSGLLNRATIAAFNEAWFRRAPRERRGEIQTIGQFFHPLDWVRGWNGAYGAGGFVQYQSVVPFGAEDVVRGQLETLSANRIPSFLAVLKRFGPERGLISFPAPGWTLALDIPARTPGLAALLDDLDEAVVGAGGRVYLAKDARVRPDRLAAMYPRLDEWRAIRDRLDPEGVMTSDLARRLGLTTNAKAAA